jgi:hypothetical protein
MPRLGDTIPPIERFWPKVDRSGGEHAGWPWMGATDRDGYGIFEERHGHAVKAHRFALSLVLKRAVVGETRHLCGNNGCCNPLHLKEGTSAENAADRLAHGRTARHERNGRAVMSTERVAALRARREEGATYATLAAEFGIGKTQVSRIVRREQWTEPKVVHGYSPADVERVVAARRAS